MRINLRRTIDSPHPKLMFVAISQFNVIAFAVRVRHLRLPQVQKKSPAIRLSKYEARPNSKTENARLI